MIKRRTVTSCAQEVLDEAFGHEPRHQEPRHLLSRSRVGYPMSWETGTRSAIEDNMRKVQQRHTVPMSVARPQD